MKVFNRGALSFAFIVADGREVIIEGRNSSIILLAKEKVTEIADADWEYIKTKYAHIYEIAENVIFADVKIVNITAKAKELENEYLADRPLIVESVIEKKVKKVR